MDAPAISVTSTRGETSSICPDELLFFIQAASKQEYLVCVLSEEEENKESPFKLSFHSAASLPIDTPSSRVLASFPQHLTHKDDHSLDIVVSTRAGTGKALPFWGSILQPLLSRVSEELTGSSLAANVVITKDEHSVANVAKNLSSRDSRHNTVVVISGDGGIIDLLNNYTPKADAPLPLLAVLPFGTGNAIFHSSHRPLYSKSKASQTVHALRTLFLGSTVDLPYFRASFSDGSVKTSFTAQAQAEDGAATSQDSQVSRMYGTIVASYGFHASILYESDTPEYRAHGDKRFGMVAGNLLKESHPYLATLEVRAPGGDFKPVARASHAYILVAMVSNLEKTFTIAPDSEPLDGTLKLIHFGAIGGERTMEVMMKAYDNGKHVGMKWEDGEEVGYEEIEEVRITTTEETPRWRKVCIDGSIVELPKGGSMTVKKEQVPRLKIFVDASVASA
ncbi:hypothetical protein VHEMI03611 [[Torrubiella] hemipterigena]|uniref:DAGKc domain-containing protein n=1 Tax=[Torrubiella] hemipterigena TaxID=1531966 RepID=A0A0A1TDX7_9HYPO|nr:hypothetical protein VHEMI03611 [[Torrubiella] hemipterigena]